MNKICHVIPFYDEQYGGSERYVKNLAAYQSSQGFDITILTTTKYRRKVGCETKNGITINRCFSYKDIWRINPISNLLPSMINLDVDLLHIHSHLYFTSNQAMFWGKVKHIPKLLHLHGGLGLPPYQTTLLKRTAKSFYDKTLGELMLKLADIIASVSLRDLHTLEKTGMIPRKKMIYLPNILDDSFNNVKPNQNSLSDDIFKIIYIGDLENWKGVDFLIKWINKNKFSFKKKLEFQFIGQGSYSTHIHNLQEKTSNNKRIKVKYLGQKPHNLIPHFLNQASSLILPSYWEGSPTVVLEAMIAKVPVIATDVGDIPYLLQYGKNGLIFDRSYKSLNKAIDFIIENPGKMETILKSAYRFVIENYNIKTVHNNLKKVYINLLNDKAIYKS